MHTFDIWVVPVIKHTILALQAPFSTNWATEDPFPIRIGCYVGKDLSLILTWAVSLMLAPWGRGIRMTTTATTNVLNEQAKSWSCCVVFSPPCNSCYPPLALCLNSSGFICCQIRIIVIYCLIDSVIRRGNFTNQVPLLTCVQNKTKLLPKCPWWKCINDCI